MSFFGSRIEYPINFHSYQSAYLILAIDADAYAFQHCLVVDSFVVPVNDLVSEETVEHEGTQMVERAARDSIEDFDSVVANERFASIVVALTLIVVWAGPSFPVAVSIRKKNAF